MKPIRPLMIVIALAVLSTGCGGGGGGGDSDSPSGPDGPLSAPAVQQDFTVGSDGSGRAALNFTVPQDATKFQLIASADNSSIAFLSLASSNGANYLDPGGQALGFSVEPGPGANAASVPSRSNDPALQAGVSYSAVAAANGGVTVNFHLLSKADPDLQSGQLIVNVFYVNSVVQAEESRAGVRAALAVMHDIYLSQAHINLLFNELDIAGPAVLPVPVDGSSFYAAASGLGINPGVNLFIGADVGDIGDTAGELLGISGSIGGPSLPSPISAVVAGLIAGQGADGQFDGDDIEIFGETFAHEVGHYLGLFHPVDIDGERVVAADPLADTGTCTILRECQADENLVGNLMFPFALSDDGGKHIVQASMTAEQRGVTNRYIAVD